MESASKPHLDRALSLIRDMVGEADHQMTGPWSVTSDDFDFSEEETRATKLLERASLHLAVLIESLALTHLLARFEKEYETAIGEGLLKSTHTPDVDYLCWGSQLLGYVSALEAAFGIKSAQAVERELDSILRATQYSICDASVFQSPPKSETEVHQRVEAVLRCIFPDLRTKPPIAKPIKNFEPDTGIPSLETLIEYKFLSADSDVKRVADEILADTRGYVSRDWTQFVFLIYEMHRLRPESEWKQLLDSAGVLRTRAIVICGEPRARAPSRPRRAARKGR